MSRLTVDQINIAWLESATLDGLKLAMRSGPEVLAAVNALILTPEGKKIASEMLNDPDYVPKSQRQLDPEEAEQAALDAAFAAQQAQEAEAASQAEAQAAAAALALVPVVDYAAEDADALTAGVVIHRDVDGRVLKLVKDYQATDEDGRPIGRPTHLEARTWAELSNKQTTAHVNAVRYAERVKTNRFKQSAESLAITDRRTAATAATEDSARLADEAVNAKDPAKLQEATRKLIDAEREQQRADEAQRQHGKIVAETWMQDHVEDFLPCQASSNIMGAYLKEKLLPMTYDNLELAFQAVKNQLPKPERVAVDAVYVAPAPNVPAAAPVAPAAPAAPIAPPAAPAPVPVTPPAAVVPPSAATAPTATPVTATNTPQVTRKPVVNGGLQPGSLSAPRPQVVTEDPSTTRSLLLREISKMDPAIYRRKLKDANYVAKLKAAGIPVVGQ